MCSMKLMIFSPDFKEISGETVPIININSGGLLESLLTIQEVNSTTHELGLRNKYRCTGPTFYFARGFKWQIARYGGFSDFLDGEGKSNVAQSTTVYCLRNMEEID